MAKLIQTSGMRYGNAPVSGDRKFEIGAVQLNAQPPIDARLVP